MAAVCEQDAEQIGNETNPPDLSRRRQIRRGDSVSSTPSTPASVYTLDAILLGIAITTLVAVAARRARPPPRLWGPSHGRLDTPPSDVQPRQRTRHRCGVAVGDGEPRRSLRLVGGEPVRAGDEAKLSTTEIEPPPPEWAIRWSLVESEGA